MRTKQIYAEQVFAEIDVAADALIAELDRLKASNADLLAALKQASELVGDIPAGSLGTQDLAYRALVVLDSAIEKATA